MKIMYFIIAILISIFFESCTSFNITKYYSDKMGVEEKIPQLYLKEDFEVAPRKEPRYGLYQSPDKLTPLDNYRPEDHSNINRTRDAFQIIEKEFKDNMYEPFDGRYYGRASWKIVNIKNSSSKLLLLPSMLTLFTINFL